MALLWSILPAHTALPGFSHLPLSIQVQPGLSISVVRVVLSKVSGASKHLHDCLGNQICATFSVGPLQSFFLAKGQRVACISAAGEYCGPKKRLHANWHRRSGAAPAAQIGQRGEPKNALQTP
ncbi:hypothetical protein B0H66DRAFT_538778 [Apodospora peruviana]|uniref:Uncharacterized protein n=1 Tax=Apodospora peruviana TaxID=516989 RepID=A0AAE0LYE3_9PEZI|nr:hypothetical protein B0H66DRAFT_538778 [Apodospora peruviana]